MKRKENPFLWALAGSLMLAILGLALMVNNGARKKACPLFLRHPAIIQDLLWTYQMAGHSSRDI